LTRDHSCETKYFDQKGQTIHAKIYNAFVLWCVCMRVSTQITRLELQLHPRMTFLSLLLSLDSESLKDGSIVRVVCWVILFVSEHSGCSSLTNYKDSSGLASITFQVASQAFRLRLIARVLPFGRTESRQKSQQAESLESKLLKAGLSLIHKELTSEELSLNKFLHPQSLQANPDQPDVVLLELGQNRRDLFCRQPAEGSSEPPKKHDDTGLVCPELGKCDFGPINCRNQANLGNAGWVHGITNSPLL